MIVVVFSLVLVLLEYTYTYIDIFLYCTRFVLSLYVLVIHLHGYNSCVKESI